MAMRRRSFITASVLATTAGPGIAVAAHGADKSSHGLRRASIDKIDAFILEMMKEKGIVGGAVAIVRESKILKTRGYGLASQEHNVTADENSVFIMASTSKMFAAITAMKLVEAGTLDLDASITSYLTYLPSHYAPVRVHHLLSHTSGLAGPGDNPAFVAESASRNRKDKKSWDEVLEPFAAEEEVAYAKTLPLKHAPGAEWRYAQYPVMLFGQIVLALTGKRYDMFVAETIFRPLKMTATRYGDVRSPVPRRNPVNYTLEHGVLENFMPLYSRNYWPAAGCNTSAVDAARYLQALEPGRLVSEKSQSRIWAHVVLDDGTVRDYGLAHTVYDYKLGKWVGHEGGGCCYFGYSPDHRLGVAVMFNTSATHLDGIDYQVAELVLA